MAEIWTIDVVSPGVAIVRSAAECLKQAADFVIDFAVPFDRCRNFIPQQFAVPFPQPVSGLSRGFLRNGEFDRDRRVVERCPTARQSLFEYVELSRLAG